MKKALSVISAFKYVTVGLGAMCLCLVSTTAYSQDDRNTWKLPDDVLGTTNQISFNQGANEVWYFMESSSLAHDPTTYRFLPNFTAPCSYGTLGTATGIECWEDASDAFHISNFDQPKVLLNASGQNQSFLTVNMPADTLAQSPGPFQLSIVAWQSPVNGNVKVVGTYTHLESQTTGVIWSVDQESTTLKSGELFTGSASFNLPRVRVRRGDVLYFTLDPDGNFNFDTTGLELTITRSEAP
jgi:hypothetical protein